MKKFNAKKVIAQMLAVGVVLTTLFPGTAYAAEVGEQVSDTTDQITTVLTENSDLIEQAVIDAIQARGGNINDQALVDQVREEVRKKIENGELKLDEKTEEETTETTTGSSKISTEDANTSSESVTVTDHTSADEVLSDGDNSSKMAATRLIVTSDVELTENYGAVTVDHYDNIYVLAYKSVEETDSAFNSFVANGITVEKDASMDAIKEDEVPEDKVAKEVTDTEVTDVKEDTSAEAQPVAETVEEHKTIVAVIDTGISDVTNDDTFKDRIIEGTSTISDSYVDDNGHGTAMAKIIAEDTVDENVMILPIKALDKDGKGTVLSVALAIKYAKEHGVDVINLSLSGVGQSNILTKAINDCYNNGITVVTAAGNDNADAMEYIPGNVDAAINIAAAEEDTDGKIVPASYTNHGDNIDFAALGTYKLVVEKEKTTLETELRGTSIASAHVAAYVALLKQINSTVDGVVSPISESDVMESLIASADDFDGTVNHTYFGYGFLSKDKLVFKNSENIDDDKKTDVPEIEEDKNTEITTQGGWFYDYWMSTSQEDMITGLFNGATKFVLMNDISFTGTWVIDAGYTFTINGNGHQIINNVPNGGSIITVNGGYLITEGNLTFNGNYHRSGHGVGERTACVDVTGNGTWKGTDTTCCHCWNYGYSGEKNLGGGAGFNIFSQEGTGIFTNCTAYDCDGAGFYIANGELNNCKAYDCSWGVWFSKIGTNVTIKNCDFNANRCDKSKNAGTDDFYGGCGIGSCWWTTANIIDCNISGSNAAVWCGYGGIAKISGSTLHNSDYGVVSDGEVTVSSSTIRSNSQSGTLIKAGTATITNSEIYSNKYGISNNGTVNMNSGDIHNNTDYGVFNSNTFTMNNGSIYSNSQGIYSNAGNVYVKGGTLRNNANCGVFNDGTSWSHISGYPNIYGNNWGVYNKWGINLYGEARIYSNNLGIENHNTVQHYGGYIYGNNADGVQNFNLYNQYGGNVDHNKAQGVWNHAGATYNYSGGYVYENGDNGLVNQGALNISTAGDIRSNGQAGVYNICGTTNVSNAQIYSNGSYGILNNANWGANDGIATVNFNSGTIHANKYGINSIGADARTYVRGGTLTNNTIGFYNNGGVSDISGGAITKSTQMNVDVADGTVNFNGGSITESGEFNYGVQIENGGTSTFNQSANIGSNNAGGVRNIAKGVSRYNVNKGATTATGTDGRDLGVYLDPGASMTIHDRLTSDVKVASYDRYTGKVIANCDNEAIANSAAQHLKLTGNKSFQKTTLNTRKYADTYADLLNAYGYNYEALWNHYNAYGRNEGRAAEDCGKTVVYRKGNGNTGKNTQIIVSQTEDTSFDTNLEANKLTDSRFSARIRTSDEFTGHKNAQWRDYVTTYWGEYNSPRAESIVYLDGKDVSKSIYNSGWATSRNGQKAYGRILTTYAGWYPTTLYAKYETGYDPNANHNDIDKPEKDDGTDDILDPNPQAPDKKEDTKPDTPRPEGLSFYFNGNGQDEGVNYTVRHISTSYQMPDVTDFMKNNYSGQGFSVLKDATYKNTQEPTKVRKAGETINTITLLNSLLGRNDCEVVVSDGNITVTQYMVWDAVPTVTMADKYWYYSEVRDMTDEEIIEQIKKTTHVMDKEDTNGQEERGNATSLKVEIEGLNRDCFDKLGEIGYTSVRGYVTDAVGNKAYATCKIHIVNAKSKNKTLDPTAGPLEASYYTYSRFIDKENYYKTKTVNGKVVPDSESGALQEDSIWYENEEYKKLIEDTLALEGTDQSVVSYEFDIHDLAASKHYCKVHFIGKFWGEDNLDNWYKQFITDAGAKVSGTLPNNKKTE